jgi:hypothetical protein
MWLVVWNEDWADEFNIFGIEVITDGYRDRLIEKLKKAVNNNINREKEYYFGTNEFIMFDYSYVLEVLKEAKKLTETESKVLFDLELVGEGQTFLDIIEMQLDEDLKNIE